MKKGKVKLAIAASGLLAFILLMSAVIHFGLKELEEPELSEPESFAESIELKVPTIPAVTKPVINIPESSEDKDISSKEESPNIITPTPVLSEVDIIPTIQATVAPKVIDFNVKETIKPTPTPVPLIVTPKPQEVLPTPTIPPKPKGTTPKQEDWVYINPEIPEELYGYDYTIKREDELLTGAMLKSMGFYYDWDKMALSAKSALEKYYTVDYTKFTSTDPNDRDKYLTDLIYWVGESSQYSISNYMEYVRTNKIISIARVVTDESLQYDNGSPIIRARVFITFKSGAESYGLKNNLEYFFDAEVTVFPNTGEDRYGYGETYPYHTFLFSYNKIHMLSDFKRSGG